MHPLLILIPVSCVLAVGLVGSKRGIGFWWAVALAILLTPIGGFIAAILSGAPRKQRRRADVRV